MRERPDGLGDDLERTVLERGIAALRRVSGQAPRFDYDSSLMGRDVPYMVRTPCHTWCSDDHVQFGRGAGIGSPTAAFDVFSQAFEGLYRHGGLRIMAMHPFLTGRPSRLLLLERLIRFVRAFPRLWWTTCGELAAYCGRPEVQARLAVDTPTMPEPDFLR